MKIRYHNILQYSFLIVFLFLFSDTVFSQKNKNKNRKGDFDKLHKLQKDDSESEFSVSTVPEKFKNSSMVILAEKRKVTEASLTFTIYDRIRIKLSDLNALEAYSEYKFIESDILEIKIEKPNKTVKLIDLTEAVDAENIKTSNLQINKLIEGDKVKKIALAGLEIGDIIDISSMSTSINGFKSTYFVNVPNTPIVYLKNEYVFSNNLLASYKLFNGAKEFTKEKYGNKVELWFEEKLIDKRASEILDYSQLTDPYYQIEISLIPEKQKKELGIDTDEIRTSMSDEELKNRVYELFKETQERDFYSDFAKAENPDKLSDEDYVSKYFYFCRDRSFLPELAFNTKGQSFNTNILNKFITHFKKRKIQFEVLLMCSKYNGRITDIIDFDDFRFGIRYKIADEYHYITSFNANSEIDLIGEYFEGTDVYIFSNINKKTKINYETETLPGLKPDNNLYKITINASFNSNLDSLNMQVNSVTTGVEKAIFANNIINNQNYFENLVEIYTAKKMLKNTYFFADNEYIGIGKDFFDGEEERLKDNFFTQLKKEKTESMKNNAKAEYEIQKYYSFNAINDGRNTENANWQEYFSIANTLQKAGKETYVFEIGNLLGSLFVVKNNDDRNIRTKPFFIDYSKNLTIKVVVKIPKGKTVLGLENLNVNFSNKIGIISSKAIIENGNIIWTLSKVQNSFKYNKTEWNNYLIFTDLASQLNHAKLILN